jgi:hypothetical protein
VQILNYAEVVGLLGSALPPGGPLTGRAVLSAVQGPTFPDLRFDLPYTGWPSDAVVAWAGIVVPTVSALVPSTAALGAPSFTLHVQGAGFLPGAVILWNGSPEPTTFVSASELTTLVNMATAQVAIPIPVAVQIAGLVTNSLTFTLTATAAAARAPDAVLASDARCEPDPAAPRTPAARILSP